MNHNIPETDENFSKDNSRFGKLYWKGTVSFAYQASRLNFDIRNSVLEWEPSKLKTQFYLNEF